MLTPILIVVAIGLVCAAILTIASKVFFVPVDETFANLRAELPGANCGACGYNGCDDYANALAEDHSLSCSLCPVGGADVAAKLAEVLGVEAGSADKEVAVVMCNGHKDAAKTIMEYQGVDVKTGARLFHQGPFPKASNNIGEFLALVHGLAMLKKMGSPLAIYSDSVTAMAWVRDRKCKSKIELCPENAYLFSLVDRAEKWLRENTYTTRIIKWKTEEWGEIPADFGRK